MIPIFLLDAKENWVCDRFVKEWYQENSDISTHDIDQAKTIWLLAGWCWNQISPQMLESKNVILTIHHIVPDKFDDQRLREFMIRDRFVNVYHVPCKKTKDQISSLTKKPIFVIPFWANQNLWFDIKDKKGIREKYGLPVDSFIVGSFQRDTEGSDLKSPKLEKGPDLFCDYVIDLSKRTENLKVLLAGWRRQYVMNRLNFAEIPFYYCELPGFDVINDLYNCLDLYVVSARHEGGPQSIIECALTRTPIISTDVGLASEFLSEESIFDESWNASPNIDAAHNNIKKIMIPSGFKKFKDMIFSL